MRGAAAYTCCKLFVRDPIVYQASSHAIETISDVLDKLLTVGIADPGQISLLYIIHHAKVTLQTRKSGR